MKTSHLRGWIFVHKWSSLVATLFLFMLCVTGLPLIFHEEIDSFLSGDEPVAAAPVATQDEESLLSFDAVVERAPAR